MRKDAFYHQRIKEIIASINPRDTYHDRLIKFGWTPVYANYIIVAYIRPAYMGQKRKIMRWIEACRETSNYTHEYRNPSQYKSVKKKQ